MTSRDPHQLRPLLQRALAGDVRAWNEFFGAIRHYLHAEVRRAAGPDNAGLDNAGPLDHSLIVQSTLRRVWERIGDQFPDGAAAGVAPDAVGRFLAWIKTILQNRTREEWRKIQRRRTHAMGSAALAVAAAPARPGLARRDQIAVEVAAALARLPDRKRQVVELFWFEGRSDAEIAQRLGCSAATVRVLRCRALRELRTPDLLNLLEE